MKELLEKLKKLQEEMRAILAVKDAEKRALNADEVKAFDGKKAELDAVQAEIKTLEDDEARAKVVDGIGAEVQRLEAIEPRQSANVQPDATPKTQSGEWKIPATAKRYGRLKHLKDERQAFAFGQWYRASRGIDSAAQWCRNNGYELRASHEEGDNTKGGYLVPTELDNALIDLREQYGVFRRNAKIVPMKADTKSTPRRDGGLTAYFVGEGAAITESNKTWSNVQLVAKKLGVLSRMSNELSEDAIINVADDLAGEIAYAFANKEDSCGFIGDGTSTYGGIRGVTPALKALSGTIANIAGLYVGTGNLYSELVLKDFGGVCGLLPVYAEIGAKWYCHKSFFCNVMQPLALAAGGSTDANVAAGAAKQFLGYPVEFTQVMPKTEANSQVCAVLGNLSMAAMLGDRKQTTIAFSDSAVVNDESVFEQDQVAVRGIERVDINVHDVGNASSTAASRVPGPVVGLITAAS